MSILRQLSETALGAAIIGGLFLLLCSAVFGGVSAAAGFAPGAGAFIALLLLGFFIWAAFFRQPEVPPPDDLPYEVILPADILDNLPSLGPRTTGYVERPETKALRANPIEHRMLLLVGQEATGKTRESAEIAKAIAAQFSTRARVYLMKRPEEPREVPAALRQHQPILLFDDLDHPWRNQPEGGVSKATDTFRRLPELLDWYSRNSHDGHCWIIANVRTEPFERVCANEECAQAAGRLKRVDLGDMEEDMEWKYWRSALEAFEMTAPDEIVPELARRNAGGFRLPYEYVRTESEKGRKELGEADVEGFGQFHDKRWQDTTGKMSARQRDLLQAMGDLRSLGVPLFREDLVELCAVRRSREYSCEALRRAWEAVRLPAELSALVRKHAKEAPDGRLLVHDSRLPEPRESISVLAPEVGGLLLRRGSQRHLSADEVVRLRESLAGLDQVLYGSALLPLLIVVNEARAALSLPAKHRRRAARRWPSGKAELSQSLTRESGAVWAAGQGILGVAYNKLPVGDPTLNQQRAIACYQAALEVYTREAYPAERATTQNNLGAAWRSLPTGDRGENLGRAIACHQAALEVYSRKAYPAEWAMMQNNLGNAWGDLPTGDWGENLREAIACYQAALEVRTREAYPAEWAMTQNNLGNAWAQLPTGDRGKNLERAIACYQAALEVYSREAYPAEWATTQNNLGNAWGDLPTGDRGKNLGRAIASYGAALEVRTREAYQADWAGTQNNLALTYADPDLGDPATNLPRAEECLEQALTVFTPEAFPHDHAKAAAILAAVQAVLQALDTP